MSNKQFPIGIQLYTVRDACQADFKGTLKAIAAMGYDAVEFAFVYGGMQPQELADFVKSLKLKTAGMHVSLEDIANANSESYRYAAALKSPCITTSLAGEVEKDWVATVKKVDIAGRVALSKGVVFTYHNHAQELSKIAVAKGKTALDYMRENTDPKAVQFELDTYWIKKGGQDPVATIQNFKGRAKQIHLKDMDPTDSSFAEVGTGLMDLPGIFKAAKAAGSEWVIVEQDTCKRPALESAKISIDNLKKAGLA